MSTIEISQIEELCNEYREGVIDDDEFRRLLIESLGYSKDVLDGQQQIADLLEIW